MFAGSPVLFIGDLSRLSLLLRYGLYDFACLAGNGAAYSWPLSLPPSGQSKGRVVLGCLGTQAVWSVILWLSVCGWSTIVSA